MWWVMMVLPELTWLPAWCCSCAARGWRRAGPWTWSRWRADPECSHPGTAWTLAVNKHCCQTPWDSAICTPKKFTYFLNKFLPLINVFCISMSWPSGQYKNIVAAYKFGVKLYIISVKFWDKKLRYSLQYFPHFFWAHL